MGIVAAGVHDVRRLRAVRNVVLLVNGQGVHVRANTHDGPAFADARHHAGAAHAGLRFIAQFGERFGDLARRAKLLKAKFRVHVKVASPGHDAVGERARVFKSIGMIGHFASPAVAMTHDILTQSRACG